MVMDTLFKVPLQVAEILIQLQTGLNQDQHWWFNCMKDCNNIHFCSVTQHPFLNQLNQTHDGKNDGLPERGSSESNVGHILLKSKESLCVCYLHNSRSIHHVQQ